jgi:hypothetical protein
MNRRSFFKCLGAGAATLALSEAIPFGRVWSFPSKIVVPENPFLTFTDLATLEAQYLAPAAKQMAREMDEILLRDLAFFSGQDWPTPTMLCETTITLKRTAGIDFELVPA